jgi:hypothetical protein
MIIAFELTRLYHTKFNKDLIFFQETVIFDWLEHFVIVAFRVFCDSIRPENLGSSSGSRLLPLFAVRMQARLIH